MCICIGIRKTSLTGRFYRATYKKTGWVSLSLPWAVISSNETRLSPALLKVEAFLCLSGFLNPLAPSQQSTCLIQRTPLTLSAKAKSAKVAADQIANGSGPSGVRGSSKSKVSGLFAVAVAVAAMKSALLTAFSRSSRLIRGGRW
jgi:hypothetical protein